MESVKAEVVYVDEMLKDLIPGFLENRRKELLELEGLVAQSNFDELSRFGHKLKGTALNYGFQRLGEIAASLEQAAISKNIDVIQRLSQDIKMHLANMQINYVD